MVTTTSNAAIRSAPRSGRCFAPSRRVTRGIDPSTRGVSAACGRRPFRSAQCAAVDVPYFLDAIGHHVYAGDTALHIAAAAYRADIARELVDLGANARARNRLGSEPLHYAAVGGPGSKHWNPEAQAATIAFLIRAGADPNAANKSGAGPLHQAVRTTVRRRGACSARERRGSASRERERVHAASPGGSEHRSRGKRERRPLESNRLRSFACSSRRGARLTDTDRHGKTVADSIRGERLADILDRSGGARVELPRCSRRRRRRHEQRATTLTAALGSERTQAALSNALHR